MSADCNDGQRSVINSDYDYGDWMYVLLDKLPTVAECVQAIYQHASAYGTNKPTSKFFDADYRLSPSSDPPASKKTRTKRIIAIMKMYCHYKKPLQG